MIINQIHFINAFDAVALEEKYDTVYRFPENVGIIINSGNASAIE